MRYAYRRMLADPTIKASFCAKIFSVMAQDLVVGPPKWLKKDARSIEIAEFVEWNLTAGTVEGVPGLVWDILSGGLIDGFSVSEKVWGEPEIKGRWRGKRRLAALKAKDVYQDLVLEIDEFKNIVGVKGLRYNAGQTFDPADFVIYSHLGLFENPTGMSDFRAVYGKWWLLDTVWKLRAIACDKRSMPIMVGHWKDVSQQRTLEASLSRVRYQNWITAPEEAKIEALNIAGQADQIFKDTIRDLKEDIVTGLKGAILTQMTSSDQRGDSQVHEGTSNAFEWYLSAAVLNVLNGHESGLIRHIVDVNYQGVGDYPRASFGGIDDAELKESLNIDRTLWDMGWPLDQDEMETRYGRKWQADPQKAIKKPDGGGGPPGADGGALAGMMGGGGPPPDGDGGQQPPEGDAPPDQPGQPGGGDDTDQNGLLADILSGVMGGDDEAIDAMDGDQQDAGQQEDDDTRESLIADIMSGAMGDDDDALDALHGDDHHQFAESEPGGDDGYNLAEFYASIWNAKTAAGLDVTDKEIDAAQDELAPFGWHLGHTGEKWAPEREPLTFAEQARAPKGGIHVAGKWFPGGRWIPAPVMAQATPAERAAIEEPQEKRKAERKARGTVDAGKIRKLIGDAAGLELSAPETSRAMRTFRSLKSHHGDLIHHRLEEIAEGLRKAHDEVGNDVQREFFAKQLAAVGVMLDKAGDAPEIEKPAEKPTKKPAKKTSDHFESLAAIVRKNGGISRASLGNDWNIGEDFAQSGLLNIFKKNGGVGLDDMAQQLEAAGHIKVPANRNADDYLMELLQNKASSRHVDLTKQIEAEQAAYHKELEDARKHHEAAEIANAVREGEEAGRAEGEAWEAGEGFGGMADEEGAEGDVGDFDFGADEADRPAAVDRKEKEPWEMTAKEWGENNHAEQMKDEYRSSAAPMLKDAWNKAGKTDSPNARTLTQKQVQKLIDKHGEGIRGNPLITSVDRGEFGASSLYGGDYWLSKTSGGQYMIVANDKDFQPNLTHKRELQTALAAGKPVPPEVLADYPDLLNGLRGK
jgi:hypothetical protein